jgi:hypothetical protein
MDPPSNPRGRSRRRGGGGGGGSGGTSADATVPTDETDQTASAHRKRKVLTNVTNDDKAPGTKVKTAPKVRGVDVLVGAVVAVARLKGLRL